MAASRPRDVPGRVKTLAGGLGIAAGVLAVLAGYPLWVQFFGPLYQHGSPSPPTWPRCTTCWLRSR